MELPHRLYVKYLTSRKMTPYEMRAECIARNLLPPDDDFIRELMVELGAFPKTWKPVIEQNNVPFRRWLRDQGIGFLWLQDEDTKAAMDLVHRASVRRDYETILLAHGDVRKARRELAVKYPESMVPSEMALSRFYEVFWNIGAMSPEGLFNYLEVDIQREDYKVALRGDLLATYSQLGLVQTIQQEQLLQQMMMMGYAAAVTATRDMGRMSGQMLAALTAAAVAGANAGEALRQQHVTSEGDFSMRKDAADFMSRIVQAPRIPGIDEIDVIEAVHVEEIEDAEHGNVRQLAVRN